ncbi:putative periodic tryptophan protein 1 [Cryptotermes secundus]|uniref:Putative periodic tryptophan protein 1 n=1 Tax=Cryptotermes secundus TaxID=105785 RepID=A0A2J7RI32_9NEOP|nr:periodic tryptophan protein 1 homolog [Cryptotermes secundus]PNF40490.1 putative periodic tryptophan protein 1 [Cryptotermes secundus]
MDNEDAPSSVNFIPCVKWVRKGVAKEIPEKVQLTEEELQEILNETRAEVRTVEEDDSGNKGTQKNPISDAFDEYHFDQYDDEDTKPNAGLFIGDLALYSSGHGDPYVTLDGSEDDDSEKEDDMINPKDNLILVGHVEADTSILEVYVYNEEEGSLYVHHDLLLPAFPLCIEWLNYDPGEEKPGNLCAVGSMSPVIGVWDIDIVGCLEPVFELGHRANKKKGIARCGHRDAVLDLSWNTNVTHVMASGSADQTVLLWDLNSGMVASTLSSFEEKVQTLQWHPFEGQTLLVGSCDKLTRVFDCRVEDSHRDWAVNGEVECVLWDHFNPFNFLVGTNSGSIHYIDCRSDTSLWELSAHTKEVTGLALSSQCPGMLMTAGGDAKLRTWDILGGKPSLVYDQQQKLGALLCLDACPDLPFTVCIGGENKKHNFTVVDIMDISAVQNRFADRKLVGAIKLEERREGGGGSTSVEMADDMIESLSLESKDQDQPSSSRVTMKTFQSSHLKNRHIHRRKRGMIKKKK